MLCRNVPECYIDVVKMTYWNGRWHTEMKEQWHTEMKKWWHTEMKKRWCTEMNQISDLLKWL